MALTNATNATLLPTNATILTPIVTSSRYGRRPTCVQLNSMCMMAIQAMKLAMLTSNMTNIKLNVNGTSSNREKMFSNATRYFTRTSSNNTIKIPQSKPQLPPACQLYQVMCRSTPTIDGLAHIMRIGMTMGVFGMLAFVLNIFVIVRIICQNVRKIHQSKLYFLSMAFSDMYFGICCFIYTLMMYKVVVIDPTPRNRVIINKWWQISVHVTFCASLFHVVMITGDRFMATTFPLVHKISITRKKVLVLIFVLWLIAVILSLLPYWLDSPDFSVWFAALTITFGSVLLIVTYAHISTVAIKRRKTLKELSKNKRTINGSVKSINTSLLSASITSTFIVCNMYGAIYAYMYLISNVDKNMIATFVELLLLNINAAVNPVLYTIVEFLHNKMHKRKTSLTTDSTARDRKTTTCSTIDRVTRSAESIATISSEI